jgi:hypothetical protein
MQAATPLGLGREQAIRVSGVEEQLKYPDVPLSKG